ncbi:hypothetical protein, partial [Promicromonospora kroppenstedtii]|uniref:hypothetical protein n=1 Tax=Promicromonospora kroppenstedtii TaxID=440482 RepID=UPI00056554A1
AEVVTYTSADDESGEVILAAPTAALWEIDTRVDVWDAATSAPVVETLAQILVEGIEQAGDSLVATVDHALTPLPPRGHPPTPTPSQASSARPSRSRTAATSSLS